MKKIKTTLHLKKFSIANLNSLSIKGGNPYLILDTETNPITTFTLGADGNICKTYDINDEECIGTLGVPRSLNNDCGGGNQLAATQNEHEC